MEETVLTVKAIFDCAHEIASPEERHAYLDRVCAGAPEKRAEVDSLLRAYEAAGSILEPPTVDEPATGPYQPSNDDAATVTDAVRDTTFPADEDLGQHIGPFRLIRALGEGGMGSVYLAEQAQPVRRQVALKIIKPGMDSAQVVARFEAERQALALMDHPNIARVYEAGTIPGEPGSAGAGRPFFVMELVQGTPFTRFCDQNKLTLRDRLQLFIPVCQAIQHAHQKGIIHRDIKPSNVLVTLVDGKPVAKVIDFGIAKAIQQPLTAEPAFTQMGSVLGTLEYMSPEQADGNPLSVDTRSDVYSLGVLLYELLTGVTPLDQGRLRKSGLMDALLMIIEEEPPRPSTRLSGLGERQSVIAERRQTEPVKLARTLRGELDWIVMKALEKDRTRRYGSASDLAADVQRYLDDEPVQACPPTVRYRLGKFARKHWVLATLISGGVTAAVAVIAALTVTVVLVSQANRTKSAALKETRAALNATTDAVLESFLGRNTAPTSSERAYLRGLLGHYEKLAAVVGNSQEAREIRAEGNFRIAQIRTFLGEYPEARDSYLQAIDLFAGLAAEFPTHEEYRDEQAKAANSLGFLLWKIKENQAALAPFQQAIDLWSQLCTESPEDITYRYHRAMARDNFGLILHDLHRETEAEQAYREAIAWLKEVVAAAPDIPEYADKLADAHSNLGVVLGHRPGSKAAAASAQAYQQSMTIRAKLAHDHPDVPHYQVRLATVQANLAHGLWAQNKREAAVAVYEKAIRTQNQLIAVFPAVPDYHENLAISLNDLGTFWRELGKFVDAEKCFRRAVDLNERLAGNAKDMRTYQLHLSASYSNLANTVRDLHRPAEALTWYAKAEKLLQPMVARHPEDADACSTLRNTHWDRANALGQLGRHAEAIQDWQQALTLDTGPDKPSIALFLATAQLEEKLTKVAGSVPAAELYSDARTFAQASAAADSQHEPGLQKQYAGRAVALLQQAQKAGYFRPGSHLEELKSDRVFDAIRGQPAFRKLLSSTPTVP